MVGPGSGAASIEGQTGATRKFDETAHREGQGGGISEGLRNEFMSKFDTSSCSSEINPLRTKQDE